MKKVRQFRVFVSSPGDVRDERALAVKVLDALPFKPWARGLLTIELISWDDDRATVAMPAHLTPQEAINRGLAKPSECDVVVVFLWSRIGTPISAEDSGDGKAYRSGTEWEYLDAISVAKGDAAERPHVLVYRRRQDPGFDRLDPKFDELNAQWKQVDDFFQEHFFIKNRGATDYETQTEFQAKLDKHLEQFFWKELGEPRPTGRGRARWKHEPYPGLSSLEPHQALIFFGRGQETDELVRRIMSPSLALLTVVGASGSGKSTLLLMLGGMLSPSSGKVLFETQSLYGLSPDERARLRRRNIGFVFQQFNLVPYLTAQENVQVPLYIAGAASQEQETRAAALLERFGLGDRRHHKPSELSVGQQQRVALARVLANDPKVILADEPTGNLDPETGQQVIEFLAELNAEGRTIVMVTHDPRAAERCKRVMRLVDGMIQAEEAASYGLEVLANGGWQGPEARSL